MSASKCYVLLLCKTLNLNMFEYNGALEALNTCSSDNCRRQDPETPQLLGTCCRTDISPSQHGLVVFRLSASHRDISNLLDSNRPILCKQECSLLKVFEFVDTPCRNRSCGSFCSLTRMFRWRSFWRKNIYSNSSSGTSNRNIKK
jgi:hypothetical protein